jgi:hypothetical protein
MRLPRNSHAKLAVAVRRLRQSSEEVRLRHRLRAQVSEQWVVRGKRSVPSINRLLADHEVVNADGRSDVARCLGFPILKRRAGGIGDTIDGIEETRHRRGIDQCGRTQGQEQRSARLSQGVIIIAERRLSERHELLTMNDATVSYPGHDNREIEGLVRVFGARTEQLHMAGGSIGTLVEGRDTSRDQLDLGMSDGAILIGEIAHRGTR